MEKENAELRDRLEKENALLREQLDASRSGLQVSIYSSRHQNLGKEFRYNVQKVVDMYFIYFIM